MRTTALIFLSALALASVGCVKKDEQKTTAAPTPPAVAPAAGISVSSLTVGHALGPDKTVPGSAATIAPRDTIYVSIATTGSGETTLKSRWTFLANGQSTLVNEDTQKVRTTGPATHEFHISKPDGWPKGDYQVEVFVNDASAATRRFAVT